MRISDLPPQLPVSYGEYQPETITTKGALEFVPTNECQPVLAMFPPIAIAHLRRRLLSWPVIQPATPDDVHSISGWMAVRVAQLLPDPPQRGADVLVWLLPPQGGPDGLAPAASCMLHWASPARTSPDGSPAVHEETATDGRHPGRGPA